MNTDWRDTCKTNAAALMHLLKNELRTDCRFIVGEGAGQKVHLPADWEELLKVAAEAGDVDKLRHLKKAGADLSVKYGEGMCMSLLHIAAHKGSVEATEWLLDQGWSVHDMDADGWTALHFAANGGSVEVLELLLGRGADPDVRHSDGESILDIIIRLHPEISSTIDRAICSRIRT